MFKISSKLNNKKQNFHDITYKDNMLFLPMKATKKSWNFMILICCFEYLKFTKNESVFFSALRTSYILKGIGIFNNQCDQLPLFSLYHYVISS